MGSFKLFLLNEGNAYLGHRISDVLNAVQSVSQDMHGMGSRHLNKVAEDIVNEIRKILHDSWNPNQMKHLIDLQTIGVALMKCIDEKDDLKELLPNIANNLQDLASKLGQKVNDLKAPEQESEQTPEQPDINQEQPEQAGDQMTPPEQIGQQTMPPDQGMPTSLQGELPGPPQQNSADVSLPPKQ